MIYTSNQFKISFSVPGVTIDNKSWDKFAGGDHEAETQNFPPGGMEPSIAVGGISKRNQATLERAWDDTLIGAWRNLDGAVNSPCSIGITSLKKRGTKVGNQHSFTGIVRSVKRPDQDTTSSSIAMLQVVIELNEPVTG